MKHVCLYFIRRTTQPGHYRFFLIPPKNPYSNQATQKNTCQIFVPKEIPKSKISNPKKSFDHPSHLKCRVPWGFDVHATNTSPLDPVVTDDRWKYKRLCKRNILLFFFFLALLRNHCYSFHRTKWRSNSGYAIKPKKPVKRQTDTRMQWNTLQVGFFLFISFKEK